MSTDKQIMADYMGGYRLDDIMRSNMPDKAERYFYMRYKRVLEAQKRGQVYFSVDVMVGLLISARLMASLLIARNLDIDSELAVMLDRSQERIQELLETVDEEVVRDSTERAACNETLREQNARAWKTIRARERELGFRLPKSA